MGSREGEGVSLAVPPVALFVKWDERSRGDNSGDTSSPIGNGGDVSGKHEAGEGGGGTVETAQAGRGKWGAEGRAEGSGEGSGERSREKLQPEFYPRPDGDVYVCCTHGPRCLMDPTPLPVDPNSITPDAKVRQQLL